MKLSMWMIANRLSPIIDIKTFIHTDAKPVLNSARLVYATNCVYVYQEKDHVVYDGEGDRIYLYGLTVKEAFEILQGVFDYYQDWESQIQDDLKQRNYDQFLEHSWLLFGNPMVLMDANSHVLALTTGHDIGVMDAEWSYLTKYRYVSLAAMQTMKHMTHTDFEHPGIQRYHPVPGGPAAYGGASYNLQFANIACGRLTVLEVNRSLNTGDFQLMEKMAGFLEPVLGTANGDQASGFSVFYDLLFRKPYSDSELSMQLSYREWKKDDLFQVALIQPFREASPRTTLDVLAATIRNQFPDTAALIKEPYVVVLANHALAADHTFTDFLGVLEKNATIKTGFSLPVNGVQQLPNLFKQAVNAIRYGTIYMPGDSIYHFDAFSVYYILDAPYLADKLHACHPAVRKMWRMKSSQKDELFDTLKVYLDSERSLTKTAAKLYTHRNTVLYRIKKCEEMLNSNLENADTRYYVRLSMHFLEVAGEVQAKKLYNYSVFAKLPENT